MLRDVRDPDLIASVEFELLENGNLVFNRLIYRKGMPMDDVKFNAKIEITISRSDGTVENRTVDESCNLSVDELGQWVTTVVPPMAANLVDLNRRFWESP